MPAWAYHPYRLFWQVADLLFPPRCVGCGRLGERWCAACQAQVPRLGGSSLCPACGYPLPAADEMCPTCSQGPPRWGFDEARAWAFYEGMMARVIRALKYRRRFGLGETLARALAVWARDLPWPPGCLVPVPLAPARRRARGYNQVSLVARPLAWLLKMPYCPQALQRRDGPTQVGLDWRARWHNVRRAFHAAPRVRGRIVWLVDDVMTTGATLHAAALALKRAGARAVYALTWARVPRRISPAARPTRSRSSPHVVLEPRTSSYPRREVAHVRSPR
ncbi:MAG: ComF family protein [Chloroflexi bacterium]|nr:ComF family protein [Chloroflexota bacterium]